MNLGNEMTIAFCNAYHEMDRHAVECKQCLLYLRFGDNTVCEKGREIIARNLYCADTTTITPSPEMQKGAKSE